jgi:hypothetical protein
LVCLDQENLATLVQDYFFNVDVFLFCFQKNTSMQLRVQHQF